MLDWHEWFRYDAESGALYWNKCTSATGTGPNQPGKLAGCRKHHYGYPIVNLMGRTYLQHRIVWEMHYGDIPEGYTVDHINRVRSDNRLSNLRLATLSEQAQNKQHPQRCSKTGRWKERVE
jgi:hypothetical protein